MKRRNGIPTGAYAERSERTATWSDRFFHQVRVLVDAHWSVRRRYRWLLDALESLEAGLARVDEDELREFGETVRTDLIRHGETNAIVSRAFAWIGEVASRTLATRPDDVQMLAAATMLRAGFAELPRGRGSSLAIAIAAVTRALGGHSVEFVNAREEQSAIAHECLRPLYAALGLRSALVTRETAADELRAAYSSAITHVSGSRLLHDYLTDRVLLRESKSRPRLALERLVQPASARLEQLALGGLHCAFIDDVDQVLIDDSQRPIAVAEGGRSSELHDSNVQALALARELREGEHFSVDPDAWSVTWSAAGESALGSACSQLRGAWQRPAWRSNLVRVALSAVYLWQTGVTHEFRAGQLKLMGPGKEHAERASAELVSMLALLDSPQDAPHEFAQRRMSLPRFFRRYLKLAGCASTLTEVRRELSVTYELSVQCVPASDEVEPQFSRRMAFLSVSDRDRVLAEQLRAITDAGDAALVGLRTTEGMLKLQASLQQAGLTVSCVGLTPTGVPSGTELAEAGESGRVTLVTIQGLRVGAVEDPARLHVVAAEPMGTRRLDRVLFGHAQGSAVESPLESYVALDDALLAGQYPQLLGVFFERSARPDASIPERVLRPFVYRAQRNQERNMYARRKAMLKAEESQGVTLAFGGGDH